AAGDRAFAEAYGGAEAAVAAGGARGSEGWIEAQQALSRLEAARQPTTHALGELDRLAVGRIDMATSEEDFAFLNDALAAVERMAAGQQERLERLRERLSGR
ncbi:MAG TPA: hypothetical protein VN231_13550, partial [Allosphingosinicella sp.]|nr:hypothetical protein [Allosphingosinicella sp.]